MEYEAQYDPNNDFAIFGVGDPTSGGLQTMKEKMNMADAGEEKESSSEEEEEELPKTETKVSATELPEDKEIHSD